MANMLPLMEIGKFTMCISFDHLYVAKVTTYIIYTKNQVEKIGSFGCHLRPQRWSVVFCYEPQEEQQRARGHGLSVARGRGSRS